MANQTVQRIYPSIEELSTNSTNRRPNANSLKLTTKSKPHQTIFEFRCPVIGCVYHKDSPRYFSQYTYLRQHFKKVHAFKLHACKLCGKGFAALSDCKRHSSFCGTSFKCETCGNEYNSREALLTHVKRKQHKVPNDVKVKKSTTKHEADHRKFQKMLCWPNQNCVLIISNQNQPKVVSKTSRLILPKPSTLSNNVNEEEQMSHSLNHIGIQTEMTATYWKKKFLSASVRTNEKYLVTGDGQTNINVLDKNLSVKDNSCQTDVIAKKRVQSVTTQTNISPEDGEPLSSLINDNVFISTGVVANHMWSCSTSTNENLNKSIQTLDELDVETRFPMSPAVTASTQTSPRTLKVYPNYLGGERMLDSPLNKYFNIDIGNFNEFNSVFPISSRYTNSPLLPTESQVRLLSSETQTDFQLESCLSMNENENSDSDLDMGETLSFDMHTQTSKDLESIPYDQLLTNMETQTSDPFLLSALELCDIETQTAALRQNESVGLVDTHTQTISLLGLKPDAVTNVNDMQTQTFIPHLESVFMDSHTQTPGNWSGLLDIFGDY